MAKTKELVMPIVVLVIICFVVTGALVATYHITDPIIQKVNAERADDARKAVLPGADRFQEMTDVKKIEGVTAIHKAENQAGYVISSEMKGFNGPVKIMVAFDPQGQILGVKVVEHKETPGLGTKSETPSFLNQFKDTEDLKDIDQVSGASVTSRAVTEAVGIAVEQSKVIIGGGK